jgi:glycosyltransferase involved in cell wall biosynthesis
MNPCSENHAVQDFTLPVNNGAARNHRAPVLLVGNFLSSSVGTRGVCEDLAVRLSQNGWPVLTTSDRPGRLHRLWEMLTTVWWKRNQFALAQVDVYSGPAFIWAELVATALRLVGKPYVLTLHGGNLPVFAERWPDRVRRLLRSAAAVTTPSLYLSERMTVYRSDLILQPNPLDLAAYEFRHRRNVAPRLSWLRAFCRVYNPSLAARVVALLAEEFPQLRLDMIGPDKHDGSLEAFVRTAEELEVSEQIEITGGIRKDDVSTYLNRGDIFLNTTNIDNTPVSVLEAMACGLCIVSTNVGGIPYLLKHEYNALLVPRDDPAAMAAAVRRLLAEPALAERISLNARRDVERFDWSIVLPRWEQLLAEAIPASS